jgi:degradative hydroxymethylglutaryl-CoA reductase
VDDPERVKCIIDKHRLEIIDLGNDVATSMVKRGGGVERVEARALQGRQMSIDVYVNVCQSMGANLVNTVVEYIAPYISKITGHKTGLRILTNYCLERRVSVSFSIPVEKMGWKNASGRSVCDSIMLA